MHHKLMNIHGSINPFARAWKAYETQLQRRPLITQMATSAVLWGTGDYVSQRIQKKNGRLDARRISLTSSFGGCFVGPLGHCWYTMLDSLFNRFAASGGSGVLFGKVVADMLLYTPAIIAAFLLYGCVVIDRQNPSSESSKIQQDFIASMAAQTSFWPPAMMVIFSRVPVHLQLLVVNSLSLLDVVLLSYVRTTDDFLRAVLHCIIPKRGKRDAAVAQGK